MDEGAQRRTLDQLLTEATARIRRLDARAAHEATMGGALIVDIRGATERERDGVIPGSLHIPRTVLEWRLAPESRWRTPHVDGLDQELLLVCDHGCSSVLAAATLVDLGFSRTGDVIGGFEAWRDAGLPTMRPRDHGLAPGELVGTRPPEH